MESHLIYLNIPEGNQMPRTILILAFKSIIVAMIVGLGLLSAPFRLMVWWINQAMVRLRSLYELLS